MKENLAIQQVINKHNCLKMSVQRSKTFNLTFNDIAMLTNIILVSRFATNYSCGSELGLEHVSYCRGDGNFSTYSPA